MIWQILEPFADWLGRTALASWLGASTGRVAWLFVFHLFGLTMLLSTTVLMNLRLLGVIWRRQPAANLWRELAPWNFTGLALMVLSGGLIFIGGEPTYFNGNWFRIKMEILVVAVLFHFTIFRIANRADEGRFAPLWNKIAGILSLLLWFGVAASGRAIAFLN